jgi:hypothetical protein
MNTKLTLRLNDRAIRGAKAYARKRGKSVSQIVSDYFAAIATDPQTPAQRKRSYGPLTSQLCGSLKGSRVTESDYRRHLEEKYR